MNENQGIKDFIGFWGFFCRINRRLIQMLFEVDLRNLSSKLWYSRRNLLIRTIFFQAVLRPGKNLAHATPPPRGKFSRPLTWSDQSSHLHVQKWVRGRTPKGPPNELVLQGGGQILQINRASTGCITSVRDSPTHL